MRDEAARSPSGSRWTGCSGRPRGIVQIAGQGPAEALEIVKRRRGFAFEPAGQAAHLVVQPVEGLGVFRRAGSSARHRSSATAGRAAHADRRAPRCSGARSPPRAPPAGEAGSRPIADPSGPRERAQSPWLPTPVCQLASETIPFPLARKPPERSRQNGRGTGPRRHAKKRSQPRWHGRVNFALNLALLWDGAPAIPSARRRSARRGPGLVNPQRGGDHAPATRRSGGDRQDMAEMLQASHALTVATRGKGFTEITGELARWLESIAAEDGLLTVFVCHTSASLTIQENADPNVQGGPARRARRARAGAPGLRSPRRGARRHAEPHQGDAHLGEPRHSRSRTAG